MDRLILWHRSLPPDGEDAAVRRHTSLSWCLTVAERVRAAGGELLVTVGGTVVGSFEGADLAAALDLALALLDDAGRTDPPMVVAIGAALGEVRSDGDDASWPVGVAIDRAQALAHRGHAGDLVVDEPTFEAAGDRFLFARHTGRPPLRGHVIDRGLPHRHDCRRTIRLLAPPVVPPITREALAPAEDRLRQGGGQRIILRGPRGAGARTWLSEIAAELQPAVVLNVPGVPAALEPLGSIRLALRRHFGVESPLASTLVDRGVAAEAAVVLERIGRGLSVERGQATSAVAALLDALAPGQDGRGAWVVVDPAISVDSASLRVLTDITMFEPHRISLIARLPMEARPPGALREQGALEVVLPALRLADARVVADSVLGTDPGGELARRIAVIGGETPLGVLEAARALISAGDIVHPGEGFEWRLSPRPGARAVPVDALIEERLAGLEPIERRIMEALSILATDSPEEKLERVAHQDGLTDVELERGLLSLREQQLIEAAPSTRPTSEALRIVVSSGMPPARTAELHRFVARAMVLDPEATFARATRGYYLVEGGLIDEGVEALLAAGREAVDAGYPRCAVRLAATAVQYDDSPQVRAAAAMISRSLTEPPPAFSSMPPPGAAGQTVHVPSPARLPSGEREITGETAAADLVKRVIDAIGERDFETVDRCLDMAIAEGRDRGAVNRLRAIAHAIRGDPRSAMQTLARARSIADTDESRSSREALAMSLILLQAGATGLAIRCGLSSLAVSRKLKDPRGESAALRILSRCFRALDREADAEAIEAAAAG